MRLLATNLAHVRLSSTVNCWRIDLGNQWRRRTERPDSPKGHDTRRLCRSRSRAPEGAGHPHLTFVSAVGSQMSSCADIAIAKALASSAHTFATTTFVEHPNENNAPTLPIASTVVV